MERHRNFRRAWCAGTLPGRRLRLWLWLLAASFLALPTAANADRDEIAALVEQGRHQEALTRLEEHLRENPEDVQARFLRGVALAEIGDPEAAIEVFSRLAKERPELAELHNNLAVLHANRGELEAARVALSAAVEADPASFRYRENLGDLYASLAAEAYGRAAELGDSGGRAEVKRGRIEALLADPEEEAAAATAGEDPAPSEAAPCATAVDALEDWAADWSNRDAGGYLGRYADAFQPPGDQTREDWEAERRRRLAMPGFVAVLVEDPVVEVCAERRARLTFTQTYCSDRFGDRVQKELWLSRTGDRWQIVGERVLEGPVERASPAPAPGKAGGRVFRIQLGSHRESAVAERELEGFREAHPALLSDLPARALRVDLDDRGVWYRIQFGEFADPAGAEAVCGRLKRRGQDCLVLATRGR